jgi:hypothetical protein
MKNHKPVNDNDIFQGKSPFKGFRKEAVDEWPENVIDLWTGPKWPQSRCGTSAVRVDR